MVGPGCAGVSSPCAPCSEHGVPISPSTYYEWIAKTPTRRQVRDTELVEIITAARQDKKEGAGFFGAHRRTLTAGLRRLGLLKSPCADSVPVQVERHIRWVATVLGPVMFSTANSAETSDISRGKAFDETCRTSSPSRSPPERSNRPR